MVKWNGPFRSDRSNREKWSTSKGGPIFSKLFRLDRTDPFSFRPKFPEILVEWIAPNKSCRAFQNLRSTVYLRTDRALPPKCEGEEKLRKESDWRKSSKHIHMIICHIALESNPYIRRNLLSLIPVSGQLKALRPLRVFCFIVTFLIKRSQKYTDALWPRWQSIFLPHGRFCLTSPKNPRRFALLRSRYLGAKHNASPSQQRFMTTQIKTWGPPRLVGRYWLVFLVQITLCAHIHMHCKCTPPTSPQKNTRKGGGKQGADAHRLPNLGRFAHEASHAAEKQQYGGSCSQEAGSDFRASYP